jgi:RNA polymerase sigma factor (TIGR02999 family)
MHDVSQLLEAIDRGERQAAGELLPLVYDELRRMAAHKLAQEKAGQTLEPTALVHEAYLRLVGDRDTSSGANRRHFFAAAAEAMRRILVDRARHKQTAKAGGQLQRRVLSDIGEPAWRLPQAVNQRAKSGVLYGGDATLGRPASGVFDDILDAGEISDEP